MRMRDRIKEYRARLEVINGKNNKIACRESNADIEALLRAADERERQERIKYPFGWEYAETGTWDD